eukprot:CAMPEP_0176015226 /NCGR_PEP_ID=MMETSP0120_2-20121206/7228_1 /TAXON_ID=160619 /ORGANISM="Kryptoperidinium foliaceum, Strain CCMP 1326" /LENGTH=73 /DNA_ID=CAMNT_0017348189 /DNA_START=1 /DNA_END=222 /DNA_ORIENTATION=-
MDDTIDACAGPPDFTVITATDDCDGAIDDMDVTKECCYSGDGLTRTYSVSDSCGNPASCTESLMYADTCHDAI